MTYLNEREFGRQKRAWFGTTALNRQPGSWISHHLPKTQKGRVSSTNRKRNQEISLDRLGQLAAARWFQWCAMRARNRFGQGISQQREERRVCAHILGVCSPTKISLWSQSFANELRQWNRLKFASVPDKEKNRERNKKRCRVKSDKQQRTSTLLRWASA